MHLNSETALDLAEGRLKPDKAQFWNQHLAACPACVRTLEHWRDLEADLKRPHLKSADEQDLQGVARIFTKTAADAASGLRRVLAAIIFDSFQQPAFAGARGTFDDGRQVILRAEEFDIHIKIWGEPDHRQLLGQLLPRNGEMFSSAARLHLLRQGERLESTAIDELGEFHLTDIPEGVLSLQIDLPHLTVIGAFNTNEIDPMLERL